MVAASSTEGALRPAVAAALFAAALAALVLCLYLSSPTLLHRRVPLEKSAIGLRERAGEVARKLGYAEAADTAFGYNVDGEYLEHIRETDKSATRWDRLASGQPPALLYWYRQSPRYLLPYNARAVTNSDPPRTVSGMAMVTLDTRGRLVSFEGVPPHLNEPQSQTPAAFDYSLLFTEAGLDITKFTPAEPRWLPPHPYDSLAAWEGAYPDQPDMTMQVVAAAFRGKPVYFHIIDPWNQATRQVAARQNVQAKALNAVLIVFLLLIVSAAALLAWRNLRLGRGDRKGAFRIAFVVFVLYMITWLFSAHHVPDLGEFYLFIENLAWSLMIACMMWLVYIALEPFVRRRWPRRIISWSRLLAGDWRDPLVGRDILLGAVFCFGLSLVGYLVEYVPRLMGQPPTTPAIHGLALNALQGTQQLIPTFTAQVINSFVTPAGLMFLLLLFSILLRREWIAVGLLWLLFTVIGALTGEHPAIDWAFAAASSAAILFVLLRYGLLTMVAMQFFLFTFVFYPITTDFSAWYAGSSIFAVAVALALMAYGFYTSLAGQKLFSGDLIGE
jgi:serine/threonine-protein kinase